MCSSPINLPPEEFWQGKPALGLGWKIGTPTGWGVYGTNLALQLLRAGEYLPLPFDVDPALLSPLQRILLRPMFAQYARMQRALAEHRKCQITLDFVLLRALGDRFCDDPRTQHIRGRKNIGLIFFADTAFPPAGMEAARKFDAVVTGSAWNAAVLAGLGLGNVHNVLQGIDPTVFHPAPRANWFGGRFVIFSGGKLEFRKGQDLVVAAFKVFHARHPDSLLVTAWHNLWPQTMVGLDRAGHVAGLPGLDEHSQLQIRPWLVANGLPDRSFIDCGIMPNEVMGQVLRECDVALFPNRAEGGTNLVAMESMACGLPTILSANTGHLDLARPEICYPLRTQRPVSRQAAGCGCDGWGESDVDEIVDTLEQVYRDRQTARHCGERASQFMQELTWEKQVPKLLGALREFLTGK